MGRKRMFEYGLVTPYNPHSEETKRKIGRAVKAKMKKKKNPHAVALGKLGGKKGGKARAANLTPAERSAIAKKAGIARHGGKHE